jgi:ATP-binding cassette subfamily F protein uup
MALIDLQGIHLGFGGHPLLEGVDLQLDDGERCCLVGHNGAGKSTLMKIIAGLMAADAGTVARKQGLKVAWVPQDVPDDLTGTVRRVVAGGLGDESEGATGRDEIARMLSLMELDGEADFPRLSGGMKRRVLLGRALVSRPDILLLDEPTNHLDIEAIIWLEDFLTRQVPCLLFVTHDRSFARRVSTRVVELAAGQLRSYNCRFDQFLERREAVIAAEDKHEKEFKKKLAQEEAWIRRGIKARRTRDEGRVRALKAMRAEWADRRAKVGTARIDMGQAERSGDLVIEALSLTFAWPDGQKLVEDLSIRVMRGDKIGLIGPNGSGKTTLIRLLLGELAPKTGSVRHGTRLQTAYFDQLRQQLDPQKSVWENLAGNDDSVLVNGQSRHVLAYLQDFLFSPERSRSPVHILSGGERNRLLLAKLFLRPSNLLVMDEPTNDLDADTLELLEDLLVEYRGTLLLVSHDRSFLDEVVTSTIVFEGQGRVAEYAGGYSDWLVQHQAAKAQEDQGARGGAARPDATKAAVKAPSVERPRKLGFKEQRELEALPDRISGLEEGIAALEARLADPELYRRGGGEVAELSRQLEADKAGLESAYRRWAELEALA